MNMSPKRIGLIGFDRVNALHLVGLAEAFCAAALDDGYGGRIPCYEVCTLGARSESFRAESGLEVQAQATLLTAPDLDTVIVAGGSGIRYVSETIGSWLVQRSRETRRVGAVCSGIYAVAASGLLDGRDVTTHWHHAKDLSRRFPLLKVNYKRALIQDGPCFTSNSLSGGLNLSLAMIQEDYGPQVAQAVGRELTGFLNTTADHAPVPARLDLNDHTRDRFADLVGWIVRNLHSDLSVELLARRACMCPSHFSKAFKSVFGQPPTIFVENLRLNEARRRLAKRQKTIRSVAASVGFSNPATFQRAFERRFGTRPSRYLASATTRMAARNGLHSLGAAASVEPAQFSPASAGI